MANFRYKVCKGQKVVAVSTTLREAEAEAKRVGGTVYMIGQHNPEVTVPNTTEWKSYFIKALILDGFGAPEFSLEEPVGGFLIIRETRTGLELLSVDRRSNGETYLYKPPARAREYVGTPAEALVATEDYLRNYLASLPAAAPAAPAPKKAAPKKGSLPRKIVWRKGTYTTIRNNADFEVTGEVSDNGLWGVGTNSYGQTQLTHIPSKLSVLNTDQDAGRDATVADFKYLAAILPEALYNAPNQEAVTSSPEVMAWGASLRRGQIPYRVSPAAPVPAAPAPAPKKAKDDPSRFPLRPEGVKEYDTPQDRNEEPSGETYLVTLMAPKCLAPVAFFTVDSYRARYFEGYSPDLTREYVVGYFDSDQEHPTEGYPRIHMSGVSDRADGGTGVGPACYMAGPFAAIRYNNNTTVFSSPAGGSFGWRSAAADKAWANLEKAGVAETEGAAAPLQEEIDAYDILKAGRYPLSEFESIDDIDPHLITVEGTGPEQELQVMTLAAVLNDKRTLHIDDNLYEKILRSGVLDGVKSGDNGRPVMSPAPELWDEIDLLRCTPDEVEQMAEFCSAYGGMEPKEYLTALREAVASNPTYVEGSLDALFLRNGVIEEPKPKRKRSKKNPGSAEAVAQRKHNKASYWDEAGEDDGPTQNPSASQKLSPNQQRKYLGGLKGAAREARAREILYRREHRSDKPFKTDKGQQTKPSSHAKAFAKKYGRAPSDTADAAKLAGVRKSILDKVYARGMAAWQTGHRPGASQHAWAMARVESFLTGGPTSKTADADLAREAGLKR